MKKNFANLLAVALMSLCLLNLSAIAKEKSLYARLGGKPAIIAVVDQFVANVGGDNRINGFFQATVADPARLAGFKAKLVDQICEASGGPCHYTGKDMKSAHTGMGVDAAAFHALVEDLVSALDKFQVKEADKQTLLGVLGPMNLKPAVVAPAERGSGYDR